MSGEERAGIRKLIRTHRLVLRARVSSVIEALELLIRLREKHPRIVAANLAALRAEKRGHPAATHCPECQCPVDEAGSGRPACPSCGVA